MNRVRTRASWAAERERVWVLWSDTQVILTPGDTSACDRRPRPVRAICVGLALVVASRAIAMALHLSGLSVGIVGAVIGVVAFSLTAAICMRRVQYAPSLRTVFGGRPSKALLATLASCFAALVLSLGWPHGLFWGTASVVLLAAVSEELVFRVWLPAAITGLLVTEGRVSRAKVLIAIGASQLVFGLCHTISSSQLLSAVGAAELLRLAAAGVLYSIVSIGFGWGSAAGVHAALNIHLIADDFFVYRSVSASSSAVLVAAGLLLVRPLVHQSKLPQVHSLVARS